MRCLKCSGQEMFVLTTEKYAKPMPTAKMPKMMSGKEATKRLSEKAIEKGVAVRKGDWSHKNNKQVMTRLCQLSTRFERVGTSGLLEIGE